MKKMKPVPSNMCDGVPSHRVNGSMVLSYLPCFGIQRNLLDRDKNGFQKRLLEEVAFSVMLYDMDSECISVAMVPNDLLLVGPGVKYCR